MEVTRKNFKETLPLIEASINKADFLVIDAEFTGLTSGRDVSIFDSPQEYYTTLLNGSADFLLIQYGLCAFYWNNDGKHYMNESYNFYLFPRSRPGLDKMFLCSSSSLDFLAAQGFDFNKLIKEGISYMTEPVETKLRENLTERQSKANNDKDAIAIPQENKSQIEGICKKVREFLDDPKSEEMEIDRCNAFIRRLLFQELGARFKNQAFVETKVLENKNRVLKVTRLKSADDVKGLDSQKKEKEWEEFEEAVGFSKVARMISQSEKLVIGHNMLLDMLHTLNHFFQPLSADYSSFKEFAHCMFPRLLDTKYMSSLPPFKDKVNSSVLDHLLTTLSEPPFSLPKTDSEDGRGYKRADDKCHEAGYDAYITGLCFLGMYAHLSRMRGEECYRISGADSVLLKPFINKLFLYKTAHQDSPYINLTGADPSPSRDHVFHLTFPKEWQRSDINQLFSAFGQITVQFLDETSALVALSRKDLAKTVARSFASNTRISIVPYLKYKVLANKAGNQHQLERREEMTEKFAKFRGHELTQKTQSVGSRSHGGCNSAETSNLIQRHADNIPIVRRGTVSNSTTAGSPEVSRQSVGTAATSPAQPTRKRTSSGVFQIEESEPPPKKMEISKSAEGKNHTGVTSNGRRKHSDSEKEAAKERRKDKDLVLKTFDSGIPVERVTAFKESDSWD